MFTHILLATDGSPCALRAAAVAAAIAGNFSARLTLLNVYEPIVTVGPYGGTISAGMDDTYIAETQDYALTPAGRIADQSGVAYQCRREIGQPVEEIVRVAAEERCDLIVLGSRGLSSFKSFLIGSVSDGVTHHAHCPVLIVK